MIYKETEKNKQIENNIDNSKRLNKKQKIVIATSILLVILSGIFFIILGASIDEYMPCVLGGFWIGGGVAFLGLCIIEQKIEIKSIKRKEKGKMKDYNEGKLYGGIALIVVGIAIFIGNAESYPLLIILTIIGAILILCSTKNNGNAKNDSFTLLINNCKTLIEKYETPLCLGETSCSSLLIEEITKLKTSSQTELKLEIDKIDKHAHFLLLNRSYALLSSGEYHVYYGELNPIGYAPALKKVYEGCAKWLLDNGFLSQEEYENHRRQLYENISSVG